MIRVESGSGVVYNKKGDKIGILVDSPSLQGTNNVSIVANETYEIDGTEYKATRKAEVQVPFCTPEQK
ncbi:hypothetical protein HZC07_00370 [Candidatus Micrarchaeota archaeon]|nr:hypothetical protein [Candidatus Micrarchaeota archaeon]